MKSSGLATVAQLSDYPEIIDVRTPAEFADDHIPGAINLPVLSDAERVRVGTLYKQVSPFAAKKVGAALIAINIARHLQETLADKPPHWRALIYCWRGGQRSGAMQIILRQIGWQADRLEGGYKAWRRQVLEQLDALPRALHFHVLCGATGSAKTRILQSIARLGGQVLDLEELAMHKGSVLGGLPDAPQPSQRSFESRLWQVLAALDPERPVFVEAESRRIGRLHLPDALIQRMRQGRCVEIRASLPARIAFLRQDYDYFLQHPEWLQERLQGLQGHLGRELVQHWQALAQARNWEVLVAELLERHYDPLYRRSRQASFEYPPSLGNVDTDDLSPAALERLARQIMARRTAAA
ncbi:MAG: tRNA 2-selenouridine(34) synthase MnmH [Azovibrio sp.]|uniref:tRNA 2-selenouridine(34) synthase MnmH n=1 Tax=Azovibrio sp. TaxID=1872673 RepID=UPI003C7966F5